MVPNDSPIAMPNQDHTSNRARPFRWTNPDGSINRPFDDPRTQQEKRAYDEAEARKRQRRDAQRKGEEEEALAGG